MSDITNTLPTHTEPAAQPANAIVAYVDGLKKNPVRRLIVGGMTLLTPTHLVARVVATAAIPKASVVLVDTRAPGYDE